MITPSPIDYRRLSELLTDHTNKQFKEFLISGFEHGFDIGVSEFPSISHTCKNLASARREPDVVSNLLAGEVCNGYLVGPFQEIPPQFSVYRVNPLGLVRGKWPPHKPRLIVDQSSPHDGSALSINELIPKENYSLKYITIDHAIQIILRLGPGTLCMKTDGRDAFKQVPTRPGVWSYQMVHHLGQFYFYSRLTFGSRSSPWIYDQLSTAVQWIAQNVFGVKEMLHLLDDFIAFVPAGSDCQAAMERFLRVFHELKIPLSDSKTCGPVTRIEYLGLILDTETMQLELPNEKLVRIRAIISSFLNRISVKKIELLQLLGHLGFAARAIVVGRPFVSHLLSLAHSVPELHYHVYLNQESRRDLDAWSHFLNGWNGVSLFLDPKITTQSDLELWTDASGNPDLGHGGFLAGSWFQGHWPPGLFVPATEGDKRPSMALLEMFPIFVAVLLWGHRWSRKKILFHCDNMAVVEIIKKGRSRDGRINSMMRKLAMHAAKHSFLLLAEYVPSLENGIADSLSRFQETRFRSLAPDAEEVPIPVPRSTLKYLSRR